jgi:hypothetical protein
MECIFIVIHLFVTYLLTYLRINAISVAFFNIFAGLYESVHAPITKSTFIFVSILTQNL